MKTAWMILFSLALSLPAIAAEIPPVLPELEKEITAELNKIDRDLARIAGRLSEKDFKTAETRKMLGDLCHSYPYAVDCTVVDGNGRMALVEPGEYSKFEGSDISAQEQIIRLRESKKPVMSNVIRTVEGIDAVDLEQPVFTSRGELTGSVSVLFKPEAMLAAIISPVVQGMPVDAWLMQKDGRILYDPDREEVGLMLFDDPMYKPYPQLLALGELIAGEKSGAGSYEFLGPELKKPVVKDAHWTTVGLHGTEWRLVVIHVRAGHALSAGKGLEKPETVPHDDALRSLAKNAEMTKALSGNDGSKILGMFRDFYSGHEGLYSIQWVDSRGINRLGYPEENSLINFDMKTLKTASSKPMLQALTDRKERSFDSPLVEGKTGIFFMVPVFEGGEYLGMIYTIRIKE
jgi:hypothetical protein